MADKYTKSWRPFFEVFQKPAGYDAIFELTRFLNNMREQMRAEKGLSFSPGR